ncbi:MULTISPECIES: cyanophycin synthetase [Rhodopseudomonas]|uniref:Dihydrofolate synthase/folylpolyglutamate synthase n=1 Tax=Rhodopseudomonas palustris TaxID=1076 RepID=A0A0D7DYT7_RHOPL|nr:MULTISPECIES: cyanophycin synthetase [Rhodopseudomonas]KIZ33743.1 folylpolyglutamate synthase [Rhodopseudomonas palustris]MDF3811889.1 Mur ligase family protein [Rhodopseudomonas sp. BAL398]WOK16654.1 Mur ligase family protein [Rhodopseudomonas sp. BAL398]
MFSLPKYGEGLCLARLAELLSVLGIDRARLREISVVVTGSNGKGSTAAFCAAIGRAFGLRSGLFTSPHLYRFNERFRIDGAPIDDATLARLLARIEAAIADVAQRRGESFGAFEAQFALACLYFQEAQCDFAVFEAGIGGRYDPARLIGALATCVTSVDYEHVALLGHSLELIASDKSDACAAGGVIVYGENCAALRDHLTEYNRSRDVVGLFVGDQLSIGNPISTAQGQCFDLRFDSQDFAAIEMNLLGAFQFNNAAIAIALVLLWLERSRPDATPRAIESAIRAGLRNAEWPGRLETIRQQPLTVIDVGHTPDGIRRALASLVSIHGADGWILVLGVSRDKSADAIVAALAPSFDRIICTSAHHKGADAATIADSAHRANPRADIHIAPTVALAARDALAMAQSLNRKIYVAGGLFLAIEFATVTRGGRAEDLAFF